MNRFGYSGINSDIFWQGFDFNTFKFDKKKLFFLKEKDKLFMYFPYLDWQIGDLEILVGASCCQYAQHYASDYGGLPLIFRVDLSKHLRTHSIAHPLKDGKIKRRQVVIEPSEVEISDIFIPELHIGGALSELRRLSRGDISKILAKDLVYETPGASETQYKTDIRFILRTLYLARESARKGNRPFGAIIARGEETLIESEDDTINSQNPLAHPEMLAIPRYFKNNRVAGVEGITLYSSTEPCNMCTNAIYWAGIKRVVFSVPQRVLQEYSNGPLKIPAKRIIEMYNGNTFFRGNILLEEGKEVLRSYFLKK